jgi:hypothetical protein
MSLFGFIYEANELRERLGCSIEESFRLQREAADKRMEAYEAEQAAAESNVIQFRPR